MMLYSYDTLLYPLIKRTLALLRLQIRPRRIQCQLNSYFVYRRIPSISGFSPTECPMPGYMARACESMTAGEMWTVEMPVEVCSV